MLAAIKHILTAGWSVVGRRRGTEEPPYTTEQAFHGVEIRRYGARIAAETVVAAPEAAAREIGCRRLAGYIFGGSHADAEDAGATRARGRRDGEKIAMSAPVSQRSADRGQWTIQFFMPSEKTLTCLPQPDDREVSLVSLPTETVAVRAFSGRATGEVIASQTSYLLSTVKKAGFLTAGTPAAWFYDPPSTIPLLRRNEIAVPVRTAPSTPSSRGKHQGAAPPAPPARC